MSDEERLEKLHEESRNLIRELRYLNTRIDEVQTRIFSVEGEIAVLRHSIEFKRELQRKDAEFCRIRQADLLNQTPQISHTPPKQFPETR